MVGEENWLLQGILWHPLCTCKINTKNQVSFKDRVICSICLSWAAHIPSIHLLNNGVPGSLVFGFELRLMPLASLFSGIWPWTGTIPLTFLFLQKVLGFPYHVKQPFTMVCAMLSPAVKHHDQSTQGGKGLIQAYSSQIIPHHREKSGQEPK